MGWGFCRTNISHKELLFSQCIEWTELVSKVFTGGNLKNLDWENCQVNPIETCIHKHLSLKLDCFIPFLLMTTIDQMVFLKLGFYDAH